MIVVQIIKSGSLKRYVRKCQYCGCEFSYNEKDILNTKADGEKITTVRGKHLMDVIKCPECYNDIILL